MPRPSPALLLLIALVFGGTALGAGWITNGPARALPLAVNKDAIRPGFTSLPVSDTGLEFANLLPPARAITNQILLNGSGVAAGDIDGDGLVDLFFAGLGGRSSLFRNLGAWRFTNFTASSGLALTHLDASGCALADLDGDGDLDLLVNSIGGGTAIFMNDGRGHFQFNAAAPLLNRRLGGTSMALADLDGDGLLDLYIANYRATTIRDQPPLQFNIRQENGQPAVAAINGRPLTDPEWLNRFQFAYQPLPDGGVTVLHDEQGEPDAVFRNLGQGRLAPLSWTNGTFLDEHGARLALPPFDWGLAVMVRDFNGDGVPDIYVCNDFVTPDRIWFGDGRGRFRAAPAEAIRHTCLSSMGVDVADVNRDGQDDLFVVDMFSREHWRRLVQRNEPNAKIGRFVDVATRAQAAHNTLQLARGDGTFAEVAQLAGLEASEWSWTPLFLDVDLDGWEDLLVANGFGRDNMNVDHTRRNNGSLQRLGRSAPLMEVLRIRGDYPVLDTPNAAFRNLGGLRFADVSAEWRFDTRGVSQGMCLADLDGDGDLDVVINNFNAPATLLRNDAAAPRLAIRLRGLPPNTRGISARLRVRAAGLPDQTQEMICGGRYLSSDDPMRVFACRSATNLLTVEVTWRNGTRTVVSNGLPNHLYEIAEAGAASFPNPPSAIRHPQFTPVPLPHSHALTLTDDFSRQPSLPVRISGGGPGVSWIDLDGDGRDELVIAAGRDTKPGVFHNDGEGNFTRMTNAPFDHPAARGQTTVLPWRKATGGFALLTGTGNYDDASTGRRPVEIYPLFVPVGPFDFVPPLPKPVRGGGGGGGSRGGGTGFDPFSFPSSSSSTGPLAMADVDGDGALDLFIGGRCLPGRWPEPASSRLFLQREGRMVTDTNNTPRFDKLGLVTAAVFADLDADGWPDLVVACEWGPLKIFRNARGSFTSWDAPLKTQNSKLKTQSTLTGLWTGVTAGDFDGDGRMDLVAGNWGRNTRYERYLARPLQLHYGDLNSDGSVVCIEAGYDEPSGKFFPLQSIEKLSRSIPWLQEKFPTAETFGRATIDEVLGERARGAARLEAAWRDTAIFLNRGDHFEVRPLPLEAQFAPAFGVCVADFDGDGTEDIFLTQNFFGVRHEHSRIDAGRGLLLRGDGRGGFTSVPGEVSGLMMYGEGRGAAVSDFDGDGRADLAVGQNYGATEVFRNATARPGLRVRLRGPAGNPHAIGAVLRVKFADDHFGPARELHAGAGWWSCDSPTTVLALPGAATAVSVRWPGGRETISALPPGATALTLNSDGTIAAKVP